jgi:hypothetical protein
MCAAEAAFDRAAEYAAGGRHHRHLSDQQLAAKWVAAFKKTAKWPRAPKLRKAESELSSEFRLRRASPPRHEVREDIERMVASLVADLEFLGRDCPAALEELTAAITRRIAPRYQA